MFLMVLGLLFGGATYFTFNSSRNLVEGGKAVEGTVTQVIRSGKGYCPVVRFETASGQTVEEKTGVGSNPPEFKVQDKVRVYYNESNPKEWIVDSWLNLYFLPSLLGFFSAALLLAATITTAATSCGAKNSRRSSFSQQRQ